MNQPLIELRLWRQFVAVAEALHFGRAAQALHMTQPPLTQGIAQLERLLEARLFDRTKRSVHLTAAGEALLPQWLRAFRAAHPQVQMELIEATGDVQLQALARGDIDAGFMLHSPGFAPPGLAHLQVAREPLVLALPEAHRLAGAARLALAAVLAEPLVLFPRRIVPSLHDAILGMYHAGGCEPRIAQEAIQMQTIVNLVSAGLGIAWVPDSVRQFQRSGVVYRQLGGKQAASVPACETTLVWSTATPALERFVAFVQAAS